MVRLGLGRRVGRGPRRAAAAIPALSVLAASLLNALPIVTQTGWFPDFGLLMLLAWRLLRSDVWPAWWAAPMGLFNDLVTGNPIGLSMALWPTAMLLLDLADRRTMWRDYWLEWLLAAVLIGANEAAHREAAAALGAEAEWLAIVPRIAISILSFPLAALAASVIDRWRLGQ